MMRLKAAIVFIFYHYKYIISLPWVEHVYYDGTNQERLRQYAFMRPISDIISSGELITDTELQQARNDVKPEYPAHLLFTSVSSAQLIVARKSLSQATLLIDNAVEDKQGYYKAVYVWVAYNSDEIDTCESN